MSCSGFFGIHVILLLLYFSFVEDVGSLDELKRELDEMKLVLKESQSPVVFCHNDLCSGNIIYNHKTGVRVRVLPLHVYFMLGYQVLHTTLK